MRILFIIESLRSGGKERRLIELLKGLQNYDLNIALILSRDEIHYKEIFELNVSLHILNRQIGKKETKPFFQIFSIARKFNPDIIHSWSNLMSIYSIPTKLLLRKPLINNQIVDAPKKVTRSFLSHRITFPFSNTIIANSKAGLIAYSAPPKKSTVIYNGFDFNRLNNLKEPNEVRKEINIKTDLVVGMVASFSKLKDYETYIKAANIILNNNNNVTFLCVGSGDKTKYREMVSSSAKDNVIFMDAREDVLSIMNICDIGVLSTFTEGISNALIEFMALRKPVVATDGGGTKELIINGKTGFLVREKSELELSGKIMDLLNQETLRISIGRNGYNRVIKRFNIKTMTNSFLDVYKKF